jgi:hypothetical protein
MLAIVDLETLALTVPAQVFRVDVTLFNAAGAKPPQTYILGVGANLQSGFASKEVIDYHVKKGFKEILDTSANLTLADNRERVTHLYATLSDTSLCIVPNAWFHAAQLNSLFYYFKFKPLWNMFDMGLLYRLNPSLPAPQSKKNLNMCGNDYTLYLYDYIKQNGLFDQYFAARPTA